MQEPTTATLPASLAGWQIQKRKQGPITSISVTSPEGHTALVTQFDRNPSNVLYQLANALLQDQSSSESTT